MFKWKFPENSENFIWRLTLKAMDLYRMGISLFSAFFEMICEDIFVKELW